MISDPLQLSFDVGGEAPDTATLKISGSFELDRELAKGETVGLRVVDADGAVIAQGDGYVTQVAFKDRRDPKHGTVVETQRAHTVKLGA